jgi:hypothetical protein
MPVSVDIEEIIKELAKQAIVGSLPGASPFANFVSTIFSGIHFSKEDSFRSTVNKISKSIAKDINENQPPDPYLSGAITSGLYDLEKCIKASDLSLEKLFDLGLDAKEIRKYIWEKYPKELKFGASGERQKTVAFGIDLFTQRILSEVPNLPGFTILSTKYSISLNKKMDLILRELEIMKRI